MINIDHLTSIYPGTSKGLRNFSCQFPAGVHVLLGKNGAGKTTLFRNLIGALPFKGGNCRILGEPLGRRDPEVKREIFLIPEEPFFSELTPPKYVEALSQFYPRFNHSILRELTELWEVPDSKLDRMSLGQKKKFLIAFALATQVKIMLFDEPTNGLDIGSKINFKNLNKSIFQEDQLFIFATHLVNDVKGLIDYVTVVDEGSCLGQFSLKDLEKEFITAVTPKPPAASVAMVKSQDQYLILKKRKGKEKVSFDLEIFFTVFTQNPVHVNLIMEKARG